MHSVAMGLHNPQGYNLTNIILEEYRVNSVLSERPTQRFLSLICSYNLKYADNLDYITGLLLSYSIQITCESYEWQWKPKW